MVNHINENRNAHIITIEDPIEFVHKPKNCLISQRELGEHTRSFSAALRSALREDPDVIMVGEMRDLETTALAITAAETGHLVMATLHTNSTSKTIDRVMDIFPVESRDQIRTMFAESILAILAQTLIPRKDGMGRVAAFEILIANAATRNLIREGKTYQIPTILQTGQQFGMQTLDYHLKELVNNGIITVEEAIRRSPDPKAFGDIIPDNATGAQGYLKTFNRGAGTKLELVVKYRNGRVIKGFAQDFSPKKGHFHLFPADNLSGRAIEVLVKELKGVFIVRDFNGNPQYDERKEYIEGEKVSGRKVEVTFEDGEVLVGSTLGYDSKRPGFFVFPADPKSNNISVFVLFSVVKNMRYLDTIQKGPFYSGAQV
jgi:hypothetical protein